MSEDRPQRDAPHEWTSADRAIPQTHAEKQHARAFRPVLPSRRVDGLVTGNRRIGFEHGSAPEVRNDEIEPAPPPWRCQRCRKHHTGDCTQ